MPRQQQSQPEPDQQDPEVMPPGFRPVTPPPGPAARDPLTSQQDGAGSGPASSDGNPDPTPTRTFSKEKGRAYEAIARGLLRAAGGLLNKQLAVSEDDQSWLPDDDDDKMVPPPVGRLAARRIPLGDGEDLTELEDIGMALVGLIAWAGKSLVSMWEARREARRAQPRTAQGAVVYNDPGTGEQPA